MKGYCFLQSILEWDENEYFDFVLPGIQLKTGKEYLFIPTLHREGLVDDAVAGNISEIKLLNW